MAVVLGPAGCGQQDRFSVETVNAEGSPIYELGEPERRIQGVPDLTLGAADSGPEYLQFSRIAGVALDAEGRVLVADENSHEVRVFSGSGAFLYRFGGNGSGPGELISPCCLSVDPRGHLWVRDYGNQRLNAYSVGEDRAEVVTSVPTPSVTIPPRAVPTVFHPDGSLIDVSVQLGGRSVRHHLASDGSARRRQALPEPPPERVPTFSTQTGSRLTGRIQGVWAQPIFGPRHLVAHSPNGDWAELITSDYLVRWYDAEGGLRHVITKDVAPGPRLTPEERAWEDRGIERMGAKGVLPQTTRRQPIVSLFFDQRGRLWSQRFTADGPYVADVVSDDGSYVALAEWPRNVNLARGWVDEESALGISEGRLGVMRAVRLRWRPYSGEGGGL